MGWLEKPFDQIGWKVCAVEVDELKAAFDLTQLALPLMQRQHSGRLIYMASNLATHTLSNTLASSTAKAALLAFMRNMAAEYGPYGITANAVAPAMVSTEHNQYPMLHSRQLKPLHLCGGLQRRKMSPPLLHSLPATTACLLTGSCLVLDGGKTLAA